MSIELPRNPDITYFAKTHYRGMDKIFGIQRKDRRQHMYILGKSGMGKSTLLSNMIIQDIQNGQGLCVVDPHGELVEDLLGIIPKERLNDVVYFNPADVDFHVGFNVLEVEDERYKHLVASGIMGIFTKIWANVWSSRMEYILNNCILALIDTPGTTLLGIQRMLVDKDYRQMIVNNIKDPVVRTFWVHEYEAWQDKFRNEAIAPIQNKVGQFLSSAIIRNILGQKESTINIPDIMNSKKIFLVNLSKGRVGEDNSALLGAMLITKIQLAAMERVKIQEDLREDFYLYVDEFQNFVTDSFATILSEARKYRLNLTIAHQYIAQLETDVNTVVRDAVFGNVGTMIVGRVGAADAAFLETEFTPEFTPEDFVSLPNYHVYLKLLVNGMTTRPFSARTLPPIVKMEKNARVEEFIIKNSRKLYHRPRVDVEKEISLWSSGEEDSKGVEVDENGLGTDGKYRVPCSFDDCDKIATVPFKPEPGRPVYCRDCIAKLKKGEKKPIKSGGQKSSSGNKPQASVAGLAALGLEFSPTEAKDGNQSDSRPTKRPDRPERRRSDDSSTSRERTPQNRSEGERSRPPKRDNPRGERKREERGGRDSNNRRPERQNRSERPSGPSTRRDDRAGTREQPPLPKTEKVNLGALIESAIKEDQAKRAAPKLESDVRPEPRQETPKETISLKDLAAKAAKEEVVDLEEKYQPQKPAKPKFDPSKQAGGEKMSALKAALAKAGAKPEAEPEPTLPHFETSTHKQTPTEKYQPKPTTPDATEPVPPKKEVPAGILKHILADDE